MTDYVVSAQPTIDLQHIQGVAGVDRSDGTLKVYTSENGYVSSSIAQFATIADLQANVLFAGTACVGTGPIASMYAVDSTDSTTADNGWSVIVDASSRRWKLYTGSDTIAIGVGGTANAITATFLPTPPPSANNFKVLLTPISTNTGSLTVNGLDVYNAGSACVGGEVVAGVPMLLQGTGTAFEIVPGKKQVVVDATSFATYQAAADTLTNGGILWFPPGIHGVSASDLISLNYAGITVTGRGATLQISGTLSAMTNIITLAAPGCEVREIGIGSVPDTNVSAPTNGNAFSYKANAQGVQINNVAGAKIVDVDMSQLQWGVQSTDGASKIKLLNVDMDSMGSGFTGLTHNDDIEISGGSYTNVGSLGGIQLYDPSNYRISNVYVFAAGSTGINPGGSGTSGYNARTGVIADNIVVAQNPIAVENGCDGVVIANNQAIVTEPFPNGTGIGVDAHQTTGSSSGPVRNITITDNIVRFVTDVGAFTQSVSYEYGNGITVQRANGAVPATPDDIVGVKIRGNQIYNAAASITATDNASGQTMRNVEISWNIGIFCSSGIVGSNIADLNASRNTLRGFGATLQSGTMGFNLTNVPNAVLDTNNTQSFYNASYPGGHYAFNNCASISIRNPIVGAAPGSTTGNFMTTSGTVGLYETTASGMQNVNSMWSFIRGTDITNATSLTLSTNGNYFQVNGTGTIVNMPIPSGGYDGLPIFLFFKDGATINQTTGNANEFLLSGSTNYVAPANTIVGFMYGGPGGDQWQEIFRVAP